MEFLKPVDSNEQGLDDLQISDCAYNCERCDMRDGCYVWERERQQKRLLDTIASLPLITEVDLSEPAQD